jgi:hypothetical protein
MTLTPPVPMLSETSTTRETETDAASAKRGRPLALWTAWAGLAALLVIAVPIFLRMGVWVDSTFYDVAARTVLSGGVDYRDVFDTNLPGMLWLHVLVRSLFGWSYEALRAVDIAIVAAVVWLLTRSLAPLGASVSTRVWTAFALYAFYFSLPEISHCQRDVWMLAPALAALHLRHRQVTLASERAAPTTLARAGAWEGLCWGAAIWIKPFVLFVAGVCWFVTQWSEPDRRRRLPPLAPVAGAVLVGALGVAWLLISGTWPYFYDTMVNWNSEYGGYHAYHWHTRHEVVMASAYGSMPWTLIHLVAIPLAVFALAPMQGRQARNTSSRSAALFGAFYLAWLVQTMVLQPRIHRYTMDASLLVAIAIIPGLAPVEWKSQPILRVILAEFAVWSVLVHPLAQGNRLAWWRTAITSGSARMRDALSLHPLGQNGRIAWVDLERVADFIRTTGVRDGELLCFNDSTHRLYLDLGVKPPTRYIQWGVIAQFPRRRDEVARELESTHVRIIVSDLSGIRLPPDVSLDALPDDWAERFPWNYPVAFRAGPYLVHTVNGSITDARSW